MISWDDSIGEVKFINEGEEFFFDVFFSRRLGMKFSYEFGEFIRR